MPSAGETVSMPLSARGIASAGGSHTVMLGGGSVIRKARRSEPGPTPRSPSTYAINGVVDQRAHRTSMYAGAPHTGVENLAPVASTGRSSKWIDNGLAVPARMPRSTVAGVNNRPSSAALNDITNIAGGSRIYGKAVSERTMKPIPVATTSTFTMTSVAPSASTAAASAAALAPAASRVEDGRAEAIRAARAQKMTAAWTEDERHPEKGLTKAPDTTVVAAVRACSGIFAFLVGDIVQAKDEHLAEIGIPMHTRGRIVETMTGGEEVKVEWHLEIAGGNATYTPSAWLCKTMDGLTDIEVDGPRGVRDYAAEIFNQMFREEATFLPAPNYMQGQSDVNGKMRAILIDWLIEVHMKYRLRTETLFLTVNVLDRYLSKTSIVRKRLQLVGVVAMLIAAKFEEKEPPRICDFVYITDNAYSKDDLLVTECAMLSTLNFQITAPTAAHFVERLQRANRCDETHKEVVQYLLELATLDLAMIRHTPSHLVAAALLLSNELFGRCPTWPAAMVVHARHADQALRPCVEELRALLEAASESTLQAVPKKFAQERHRSVSRIPLAPSGVFTSAASSRRQSVSARGGA